MLRRVWCSKRERTLQSCGEAAPSVRTGRSSSVPSRVETSGNARQGQKTWPAYPRSSCSVFTGGAWYETNSPRALHGIFRWVIFVPTTVTLPNQACHRYRRRLSRTALTSRGNRNTGQGDYDQRLRPPPDFGDVADASSARTSPAGATGERIRGARQSRWKRRPSSGIPIGNRVVACARVPRGPTECSAPRGARRRNLVTPKSSRLVHSLRGRKQLYRRRGG